MILFMLVCQICCYQRLIIIQDRRKWHHKSHSYIHTPPATQQSRKSEGVDIWNRFDVSITRRYDNIRQDARSAILEFRH
jgi:hypothetical protein